mgnify:CR=1 FL=1
MYEILKFKKKLIEEYLLLQEKYSKIYNNKKTIVLMQVGSFHEAYSTETRGYNLKKLSQLLNTIVSKKNKKIAKVNEDNPYMLGFPIVATSKFVKKLVDNGYHVVKIDQVTEPPNPKRAITAIYSPGTYVEDIENSKSRYMLSIYLEEVKQEVNKYILCVGISVIDLTVGTSIIYETYGSLNDDKYSLDEVLKFINNFNPSEVIINYKNLVNYNEESLLLYLELKGKNYLIYNLEKSELFNINNQNKILNEIFNIESLITPIEEFDLEKLEYARISYILILEYTKNHNQYLLDNLKYPKFYENNKYLHLGNNALKQLNVFKSSVDDSTSLFDIINFTKTGMGKRLLSFNLSNPINDVKILEDRYSKIEKLVKSKVDLKKELSNIHDIERLHRKLSLGTLNPLEFVYLDDSYKEILNLFKNLKKIKLDMFKKDVFTNLSKLVKYYNKIFNLEEIGKYNLNDINSSFFKNGFSKNIDVLQDEINDKLKQLENIKLYFDKLIDVKKKDYFNKVDDKSLVSLNYNENDKYHLLVTSKRSVMIKDKLKKLDKINLNGVCIKSESIKYKNQSSTTKICFDYMDELSNKILILLDKLKPLLKKTYVETIKKLFSENIKLLDELNKLVSEVDFLNSGKICVERNKFCKPDIVKKKRSFIEANKLRHPIIEKIIDYEYVPHDIKLDEKENGILLYGLNAAGKSSLMKAVGLCVILSQIGYYVPCESFKFSPYSSLFTRIINTDNLYKGYSSFALELVELKAVLKRSGKNTLVLADEVCNGTENKSALIIVASMILMLMKSETSFISATHLHELIKIERIKSLSKMGIYHISVRYDNDNIIFDRKILKGNGKEEYGLDFAKYLIKDGIFNEIALDVKKDLENYKFKLSRYNSNLIVEKCEVCQCKVNLETHHIEFQKDTDNNGFILNNNKSHIHKNHLSNLLVLCNKCHDKVHNDIIKIYGFKKSIKGRELVIEKN